MAFDSPYEENMSVKQLYPLVIESYPEDNILVNQMYAKHKLFKTIFMRTFLSTNCILVI